MTLPLLLLKIPLLAHQQRNSRNERRPNPTLTMSRTFPESLLRNSPLSLSSPNPATSQFDLSPLPRTELRHLEEVSFSSATRDLTNLKNSSNSKFLNNSKLPQLPHQEQLQRKMLGPLYLQANRIKICSRDLSQMCHLRSNGLIGSSSRIPLFLYRTSNSNLHLIPFYKCLIHVGTTTTVRETASKSDQTSQQVIGN